jgi:hypothetical protein
MGQYSKHYYDQQPKAVLGAPQLGSSAKGGQDSAQRRRGTGPYQKGQKKSNEMTVTQNFLLNQSSGQNTIKFENIKNSYTPLQPSRVGGGDIQTPSSIAN